MKIAISADSTCDLPEIFVKKYDVRLNAMPFLLGDDLRNDGTTGTSQDVFDYVDKTGKLPTTAAYNEMEYTEHWNKILKEYDQVIHISFSYQSSSTGLNARAAASKMKNVFTIDSESISVAFGFLVLKAAMLRDEGRNVQEILEILEQEKKKIHISFLIDTLKFLHKGGRCSSLALLGANLLRIKPRISVVDGKMTVTKKYRGKLEETALKYIDEQLEEIKPDLDYVFVAQSSIIGNEDEIEKKLKQYGFKNIMFVKVGPSICIHCGKGTVGIAYKEK